MVVKSNQSLETGLRFFGQMSAAISHEFKNVIAIINENAGLLEDMLSMAQQGVPLQDEKLMRIAASVTRQVQRADGIVQAMNRFAHSVDHDVERVDVPELLKLLVSLSAKKLAAKGVAAEVAPAVEAVAVSTNAFRLQNLVWCGLEFAVRRAGGGVRLILAAENQAAGVRITIAPVAAPGSDAAAEAFPGERETALLAALGAQAHWERSAARLVFSLPREMAP